MTDLGVPQWLRKLYFYTCFLTISKFNFLLQTCSKRKANMGESTMQISDLPSEICYLVYIRI